MIHPYLPILEKMPQHNQLCKLTAIIEMIAKVKARIRNEYSMCKEMYGISDSGNIMCYQNNLDKVNKYNTIIERLKSYYNNSVNLKTLQINSLKIV